MIYIKTFENFGENVINKITLIAKDNPPVVFENFIKDLPQADKEIILGYVKNFNNSGITLYHGTPKHKKIEDEGFKLTKGERSGFMGAIHYVDNLGIFLTDKRSVAHFFGDNRVSSSSPRYVIIECVANISNILDFTVKIPYKFNKLGSQLLNNYYGGKRTKVGKRDIFWCLDRKEFVNLIKQDGYDCVKFSEDPTKGTANTYFIMDLNKLSPKIVTFKDLYNHFQRT